MSLSHHSLEFSSKPCVLMKTDTPRQTTCKAIPTQQHFIMRTLGKVRPTVKDSKCYFVSMQAFLLHRCHPSTMS